MVLVISESCCSDSISTHLGHGTYLGTRNSASRERISNAMPMSSSDFFTSPTTPAKTVSRCLVCVIRTVTEMPPAGVRI
jgi:hypothetical protein